jgi:hypothetical protein
MNGYRNHKHGKKALINRKIYYRPEDVQNVLVPAEQEKRAKENKPHKKTSKFNNYGFDNENR